jgi:hypothetical protein
MNRRALIIGINYYKNVGILNGCVNDATNMEALLARNADGSLNYHCRLLTAEDHSSVISRRDLRKSITSLFDAPGGELLFYFSGHGAITSSGGYLASSDAEQDDLGLPMDELIGLANLSTASDICLMFDCCHSGAIGNSLGGGGHPLAKMKEGVTIIASSRDSEPSVEQGGHGLFTNAVVDALSGGAGDHMGFVTAPGIFAYVDRRFRGWGQSPVYKSHTSGLTTIRECAPLIDGGDLRRLTDFFETPDSEFKLDPEYEPDDEHGNRGEHVNIFKLEVANLFKRYRDAGLLRPSEPGEQLFWTARKSRSVALTARGKEYWGLVKGKKV